MNSFRTRPIAWVCQANYSGHSSGNVIGVQENGSGVVRSTGNSAVVGNDLEVHGTLSPLPLRQGRTRIIARSERGQGKKGQEWE